MMSEGEYNALKALYKSEGFGVMVRLIDEQINVNLGKLLGSTVSDKDELFAIINVMKGLGKSRSLVENILKEEKVNYEKEIVK